VRVSGTSKRPNNDITPQDRVIDPLPSHAAYSDDAVSLLLQGKVGEQFPGVVDDYLPLNTAVATIDVFTD
jgi:hypothetical protein